MGPAKGALHPSSFILEVGPLLLKYQLRHKAGNRGLGGNQSVPVVCVFTFDDRLRQSEPILQGIQMLVGPCANRHLVCIDVAVSALLAAWGDGEKPYFVNIHM